MRELVQDSGSVSYGPNITEVICGSARFVNQVLKGVKPADPPIESPKKVELVISPKDGEGAVTVDRSASSSRGEFQRLVPGN
jgi:ABC-type uncharacterized transport system substrate-binding protein